MERNFMAHGIYVHVPFCKQKCLYCDFFSRACSDEGLMERYGEAVCRQIAACEEGVQPGATIYFGGGTPSLLPLPALQQIVGALKQQGLWQQPREVTIECNPGTVDLERLRAYRELGFDRISFGVQSLNNVELQTIGRIHTARQAVAGIVAARQAGFKRISADLIYGLPDQSLASLQRTLEQICDLDLEHLSIYGLQVEEGTPLERLVSSGQLVLPPERETEDMYDLVQQFLPRAGYERYEISNYARAGAYSRHNLVYWQYLPYLGFGAGATGFDGFRRRRGVADVAQFILNPLAAELEELDPEELFSEFLFMNLRKQSGVSLGDWRDRYAEVFPKFAYDLRWQQVTERLQHKQFQGLVHFRDGESFALTKKGMALGNLVFGECL